MKKLTTLFRETFYPPIFLCVICSIFCVAPIFLRIPLNSPRQFDASLMGYSSFVSLIISVAIAVPMFLDWVLDLAIYNIIRSYRVKIGFVPRFAYILSLLLPDLLMIAVAIPIDGTEVVIVLYNIRNCVLALGIYGLLREANPYFHSMATALAFIAFTLVAPFSSFSWFDVDNNAFKVITIILNIVGVLSLAWVSVWWWWKVSKIVWKQITATDLMAIVIVSCVDIYVLILVIIPFIVSVEFIDDQLIIATYAEASFALVLWIAQHRLLIHEIFQKDDELSFKRMFVRYISHEVRTPLNTAKMGLQVLVEELSRLRNVGEQLDTVNDVRTSVDIAVNVLNELLMFDKLEGGSLKIERTVVSVMDFIHETAQPFQVQARLAGVTLNVRSHPEATALLTGDVTMDVDDNKMAQVLRNLISNGLKFTPRGGTVDVCAHLEDDRNDQGETISVLKVLVTDTGAGISHENQKRLFKEIVQFNPGKLQKGGGSGLGLYISNGIMRLHGGSLSVYSEGEGRGCTFTLCLPLQRRIEATFISPSVKTSPKRTDTSEIAFGFRASSRILAKRSISLDASNYSLGVTGEDVVSHKENIALGNPELPAPSGHSHRRMTLSALSNMDGHTNVPMVSLDSFTSNDSKEPLEEKSMNASSSDQGTMARYRLRVLVVDDTAISRKMQCRLLKSRCESLVEAEDGQQAVERVRESMAEGGRAIHLILMDSVMPVMDGMEATRRIRYLGYLGMIVGVTGNVSDEDREDFLSSGVDAVLPKPLEIDQLDFVISKIILESD